jgi:diguanylate cyclase (GGDEF)-like protein
VVNDRFGHGVGDRFLIEVSRRLGSTMRSMDTFARLGGDEFVILLEDISDLSEATRVAERVQMQLSEVFDLADVKITASASIGIVCNDFPYENPEEVLRDADIAMYSAKASGKAHYQVFSLSLREQTIIRLEREVDLRHALERNQFRIYYQPVYDFATGYPIGVEALLRWKHPTQGLIMPSDFIRIAEESNLIIPIDCYVLREACLQIRRWEQSYPSVRNWVVHVNLSSKHFVQPNLIETIEGIIRDTDFDATRVNLEITESAIMENLELATLTTRHLRDFGIHISIDDFGTGYASLHYLTRFPVDVLKLDQSFVPRIMTDANTREIIDTVVKLANKLGIQVIAEGVETAEQVAVLQKLGCGYGQGYLFSKPIDRDAIANMVSKLR